MICKRSKRASHPISRQWKRVQDPTVSQLRDRMREFLLGKWNLPDERLFIYYAGHGFTDFNRPRARITAI